MSALPSNSYRLALPRKWTVKEEVKRWHRKKSLSYLLKREQTSRRKSNREGSYNQKKHIQGERTQAVLSLSTSQEEHWIPLCLSTSLSLFSNISERTWREVFFSLTKFAVMKPPLHSKNWYQLISWSDGFPGQKESRKRLKGIWNEGLWRGYEMSRRRRSWKEEWENRENGEKEERLYN